MTILLQLHVFYFKLQEKQPKSGGGHGDPLASELIARLMPNGSPLAWLSKVLTSISRSVGRVVGRVAGQRTRPSPEAQSYLLGYCPVSK